jgi:hypothetical protein
MPRRQNMKRTMYYKTKWSAEDAFRCKLANKMHCPEVAVFVETPAGFPEIPYKEIDDLMYETKEASFETLAENIAEGLLKKPGVAKVTVRVEDDPQFWVEVVGQNALSESDG